MTTSLSNHTKAVLVDMYQAIRQSRICVGQQRISEADAIDILTAEWNEDIFPPDQLRREEVEAVIEGAKL